MAHKFCAKHNPRRIIERHNRDQDVDSSTNLRELWNVKLIKAARYKPTPCDIILCSRRVLNEKSDRSHIPVAFLNVLLARCTCKNLNKNVIITAWYAETEPDFSKRGDLMLIFHKPYWTKILPDCDTIASLIRIPSITHSNGGSFSVTGAIDQDHPVTDLNPHLNTVAVTILLTWRPCYIRHFKRVHLQITLISHVNLWFMRFYL